MNSFIRRTFDNYLAGLVQQDLRSYGILGESVLLLWSLLPWTLVCPPVWFALRFLLNLAILYIYSSKDLSPSPAVTTEDTYGEFCSLPCEFSNENSTALGKCVPHPQRLCVAGNDQAVSVMRPRLYFAKVAKPPPPTPVFDYFDKEIAEVKVLLKTVVVLVALHYVTQQKEIESFCRMKIYLEAARTALFQEQDSDTSTKRDQFMGNEPR